MTILDSAARPLVTFDPNNEEHRRAFYEFKKSNCWGRNIRYRFHIDNETTNLVDLINRRLIVWYLENEFEHNQPKPRRRPRLRAVK